ncbi:ROK family protein [Brachybacterium saurashtrense]|uniref:ROK family protein n=1 Tax=Brachybacterium saurashtrense TaxID=556288 RepID=A0A345YQX4_9MICO|nr:ROK family protein [Brachybacterium saurashtrense]AXK46326.1 ROK family protein [Brachybacterium saurashtrense]RRR24066.1 ROK family protein [Brachybacterium saurashtrense]
MAAKSSKDIRNESRFMVLRTVFAQHTVTRAQISAETALSPATVTTLVGELVEEGVLREAGQVSSQGGRPTTLFQANPGRGALLAVDVAETYVRVDLFDVSLARLDQERMELAPGAQTIETVAEHIRGCVETLLHRHPELEGDVLGAGISLPGQVDPVRGVDVFAPNWDWHEVPLCAALEEAVPVPVRVDNPLMALATGELWFGAGRRFRQFVSVNLGTGVGAGIIVDGQLLRGRGNSAGEWGHTTLIWNGRTCSCGRSGCVEAYVGVEGIRATLAEIAPEHELLEVPHHRDFIERLMRAEVAGDAAAQRALLRTGDYLAAGIGNLVNLLNPEHVSVLGWITRYAGAELHDRVRERIAQECLPGPSSTLSIEFTEADGEGVSLGMAVLALEAFLERVGLPSPSSALTPAPPASGGGSAPGWAVPHGGLAARRR